jgi:hypothetical protein
MTKNYFENCRIFFELFVFEIPKNQLPATDGSGESKKVLDNPYILYTFKMFLVSSALHA